MCIGDKIARGICADVKVVAESEVFCQKRHLPDPLSLLETPRHLTNDDEERVWGVHSLRHPCVIEENERN